MISYIDLNVYKADHKDLKSFKSDFQTIEILIDLPGIELVI